MNKERLSFSWENFDQCITDIERQLIFSNWTPDYIVGVKRGGLIPAIALSHRFNKPLIMMSCQLRDNKDNEVRLYEVEELPRDKKVLVVDDICDSGVTLSKIIAEFINKGFQSVKTSALFYNTSQKFVVDYQSRLIDRSNNDKWIVFPWEN